MDKKKSFLNVSSSIISRVFLLIIALYVRRLLIIHIGNGANGLNSLYSSIIGMLGVAELGIGGAIIYSMYGPIVTSDKNKIAALYQLYQKLFRIIGLVIFVAGLIVMFFLPRLIGDYEKININVYITFLLTLISVVLSYFYSADTSLIQAHKDNYIVTIIVTVACITRYILQIISILIWASFTIYLVCQIFATVFAWFLTTIIVRRMHSDIIQIRQEADQETKTEIGKNVKAMVMHKIGTVLVNSVDNTIISAYIGVNALGKYSNYTYVCGVMAGTISLFFSPLTSVIGHLCASGSKEKIKKHFDLFYTTNYLLGVIFFLGFYATIDGIIRLLFGGESEISRAAVFIITLNRFTMYMRTSTLLFRNASGTFFNDRWKPVIEGIINLLLSLLFVRIFPEKYKMVGVIMATVITTMAICYTVEPHVVFKHVFGITARLFYFRNYAYIGLFIGCMFLMDAVRQVYDNEITGIIMNVFISIGISTGVICVLCVADKRFKDEMKCLKRQIMILIRRK